MKTALCLLVALAAALPATAQAPASQAALIAVATAHGTTWMHLPLSGDYMRSFPTRARLEHIGGLATVRCTIAFDGRLTDCVVLSESPPGYGFGPAAIDLARHMRVTPVANGQSLAGQTLDLPFSMGL
jgi:protein TonB